MKKLYMILPLVALLTTCVLASAISIRASDGTVNYIGSDNSFELTKTRFSAWSNGEKGQGHITITARTSSGERVVFILGFEQSNVIEDSENRFYVNNVGSGTYWKKGIKPQRIALGTVRYDYNKVTGNLNIAGEGDINFRVTGMK